MYSVPWSSLRLEEGLDLQAEGGLRGASSSLEPGGSLEAVQVGVGPRAVPAGTIVRVPAPETCEKKYCRPFSPLPLFFPLLLFPFFFSLILCPPLPLLPPRAAPIKSTSAPDSSYLTHMTPPRLCFLFVGERGRPRKEELESLERAATIS